MSVSPAILDAMVSSGCTAEQIAAVVKAAMAGEEARLEEKRAKDRARKRKQRHGVSRDVTRTDAESKDGEDAPLSAPPNDIYSNPPHHTPNTKLGGRDDFPCPDWCEPDVWRDLKRNRKTKKLTNTPTAHKRFVAAIEAMADENWPPGRLVEEIAAKGWGGPHDPREKQRNGNVRTFGNSNQRTAELAQAKMQSFG